MPTDFAAYIPVVNRFDLLMRAVRCVPDLWADMAIVDNSPDGLPETLKFPANIRILHPPVPLSYSQSLNWALRDCLERDKAFLVNMHSDALVENADAVENLLACARQFNNRGRKWGILWTFYDILAAFNPLAMRDIGGWDTNLPNYFTDNDATRRLQLAGWETINTGIGGVSHEGSATINGDAYLRHVTGVLFPLHRAYYRAKWGGEPGSEIFADPFAVKPRNWKLI